MPESSVGARTELIDKMPHMPTNGASQNLLQQALKFVQEIKTDDKIIKIQREAFEQKKTRLREEFQGTFDTKRISHYIPMLYMPYSHGSSKLLVYFHANAEDIVLSHDMLDYMRVLLKMNVVAVEYPGYGLYTKAHQKRYNYH